MDFLRCTWKFWQKKGLPESWANFCVFENRCISSPFMLPFSPPSTCPPHKQRCKLFLVLHILVICCITSSTPKFKNVITKNSSISNDLKEQNKFYSLLTIEMQADIPFPTLPWTLSPSFLGLRCLRCSYVPTPAPTLTHRHNTHQLWLEAWTPQSCFPSFLFHAVMMLTIYIYLLLFIQRVVFLVCFLAICLLSF